MSLNAITSFFAVLAVACNALVITVALAWLLRRVVPAFWQTVIDLIGPNALALAATIAVVATIGSLYLSEGANLVPCRLCWYQRIGMYSLALVLVVAALRRDAKAWIYPFALAVGALPIATYHVLLERMPSLETGMCDVNNPCSIVWVQHFGVYTIPFMAGSGFLAIAVLALIAGRQQKEVRI
jgi:disulfide bond formation protein DsbB